MGLISITGWSGGVADGGSGFFFSLENLSTNI
jgi:hypothetical protein